MWQAQGEFAALRLEVAGGDGAAMALGNDFHQVQAQPRAMRVERGAATEEAFEDELGFVGGDARTAVTHEDMGLVFVGLDLHGHRDIGRAVAARIAQEVAQGDAQQVLVALHQHAFRAREGRRRPAGVRLFLAGILADLEQVARLQAGLFFLEHALVGEVVVHQVGHAVVGADHLEDALAHGRRELGLVQQVVRGGVDDAQGGAEFMRDHGHEVPLLGSQAHFGGDARMRFFGLAPQVAIAREDADAHGQHVHEGAQLVAVVGPEIGLEQADIAQVAHGDADVEEAEGAQEDRGDALAPPGQVQGRHEEAHDQDDAQ